MLSLPVLVLLGISFAATVVSYISDSLFAKKISKTEADYFFFLMIKGLICGVSIFALSGGIGNISLFSVLLGAAFGLICMLQSLTCLKALKMGPFSYTEVIISLSAIIPTLAGRVFWNETISGSQYIGIALMVVCILMSNDKSAGEETKKKSSKWILLCFSSALCSGMIGITQKIQQTSDFSTELPAFLISCFVVWTLIAAGIFISKRMKKDSPESELTMKFSWFHVLVCLGTGVSLALQHIINIYLVGQIPTAVFFPVVDITPFVLTSFVAMFLFKEKISLKKGIGIAIGVLSVAFVSGVIKIF